MAEPNAQEILAQQYQQLLGRIALRLQQGPKQTAYWINQIPFIRQTLARLDFGVAKWQDKEIPAAYKFGAGQAVKTLQDAGAQGIVASFGNFDRRAARALIERVSVAHAGIRRALFDGLVLGETNEKIAKAIAASLAGENKLVDLKGEPKVRLPDGRMWRPAAYGRMVARTALADASRVSFRARYLANNVDLVQIVENGTSHEECAVWEGVICSLTGETPGYPTIADATAAGLFHPNCRHRYVIATNVDQPALPDAVVEAVTEAPPAVALQGVLPVALPQPPASSVAPAPSEAAVKAKATKPKKPSAAAAKAKKAAAETSVVTAAVAAMKSAALKPEAGPATVGKVATPTTTAGKATASLLQQLALPPDATVEQMRAKQKELAASIKEASSKFNALLKLKTVNPTEDILTELSAVDFGLKQLVKTRAKLSKLIKTAEAVAIQKISAGASPVAAPPPPAPAGPLTGKALADAAAAALKDAGLPSVTAPFQIAAQISKQKSTIQKLIAVRDSYVKQAAADPDNTSLTTNVHLAEAQLKKQQQQLQKLTKAHDMALNLQAANAAAAPPPPPAVPPGTGGGKIPSLSLVQQTQKLLSTLGLPEKPTIIQLTKKITALKADKKMLEAGGDTAAATKIGDAITFLSEMKALKQTPGGADVLATGVPAAAAASGAPAGSALRAELARTPEATLQPGKRIAPSQAAGTFGAVPTDGLPPARVHSEYHLQTSQHTEAAIKLRLESEYKRAITAWVNGDYRGMRKTQNADSEQQLRERMGPSWDSVAATHIRNARVLAQVLETLPAYDASKKPLYRGESISTPERLQEIRETFKVGSEFTSRTHSSFTTDKDRAESFGAPAFKHVVGSKPSADEASRLGSGVSYILRGKTTARSIKGVSALSGENEVLALRGAKYRVVFYEEYARRDPNRPAIRIVLEEI